MMIALAGNQNCGKTTLFNQLTGARQHVGNFPGVTVEQKTGLVLGQKDCQVTDLPGVYSIRPFSAEEKVTRDFLINEKPDGIINIVDATNIERNLYLTLQLISLNLPMVLALNMMDEVQSNGGQINISLLESSLGIPVVPISAVNNEGIEELVKITLRTVKSRTLPKVYDFCPPGPVHRCIHALCHQIEDHAQDSSLPVRFAALKLIEGDSDIIDRLSLTQNELEMAEHSIIQMEDESGFDRDASIADMRYSFIDKLCSEAVTRTGESRESRRSSRIDMLLTGKYTAIPIFVVVMILIFYLSFNVIGSFLSSLLEMGISFLTALADSGLKAYGINPIVNSLLIDGVFAGVGSVLSFLPVIITLFFFLSVLEDTGYMARVAFVMDKPLRRLGLSGRSIVPMIMGFGCTVPAVMATRTLSSERDRNMTILLTPFMSCSAKVPIYAFFTAAFFRRGQALVMISLYLFGVIIAVFASLVLKKTVFYGNPVPFLMELPNYRFPSLKSVFLLMWEKAKDFLHRAFTIIFLAVIIIWFLQTFDIRFNLVADNSVSILAAVGRVIAFLFVPLGFGDWRCSTALITGLLAKESVVSTLGVLLGNAPLFSLFTPASALSFLTFTLLYTPCVAAIAAVKREMHSGLKAAGVSLMQCIIAWIFSFAVYHIAVLII